MTSETSLESGLTSVAEALRRVEGVALAVLFGSYAKGTSHRYSDIDLLVVFESKEALDRSRKELYQKLGETGFFVQALAWSPEELRDAEPTFLRDVFSHGVILHLRHPIRLPAQHLATSPVAIVTYSMKGLTQKEKQSLIYELYGRRSGRYAYPGLLDQTSGRKLGRNAFMVSRKHLKEFSNTFRKHSVEFEAIDVYVPAEPTAISF
ncbi:MAG: nucleotidyltransferase domain-containing protein [Candidatus Geothermarchaeales archaeon]